MSEPSAFQARVNAEAALDVLEAAIKREVEAEIIDNVDDAKTEAREALIQEIMAELDSAIEQAEAESAPEVGTHEAWGKDDLIGLRAVRVWFEESYAE